MLNWIYHALNGRQDGAQNQDQSTTEMAAESFTSGNSELGSAQNPRDIILSVLKGTKMDGEQEKINKAILGDFLENLIRVMKTLDKHFSSLYDKLHYTGSYYENLRISNANEFDINLVLKLPFHTEVRKIEYIDDVKSFMKYKLNTEVKYNEILKENEEILTLFFEGEYLIPAKVRIWLQGVVDRALSELRRIWLHRAMGRALLQFPTIPDVVKIIPSASGPAKTMKLKISDDYEIDIDLVPVFQFSFPEWPSGARSDMLTTFPVTDNKLFWFFVPKDFSADGTRVNVIDAKRLWRIHFPEIEKKIIHDRGYVKPIIRLLKALRDNENWKILASYYLKTVVLWLVEKNPNPDYWAVDKLHDRLIEALESLKECVKKRYIPYYFYPRCNLIAKIGSAEADKIHNRLERILRKIRINPKSIEKHFSCSKNKLTECYNTS